MRIHQIKRLLTLFRCIFETLEENHNLLQGIPNGKLQQQYGVATLSVGPPKALLFLVFRFKNTVLKDLNPSTRLCAQHRRWNRT